MESLNKNEKNIYDFLKTFYEKEGFSPSVREIAEAVGISSTSTVFNCLISLRDKGFVAKSGSKSRSVVPVKKTDGGSGMLRVPIISHFDPKRNEKKSLSENINGYVDFPAALAGGNRLFAYRISGGAPSELGVFEGDIVIFDPEPPFRANDLTVVLSGGIISVKLYERGDHVLGKVLANFRFYK